MKPISCFCAKCQEPLFDQVYQHGRTDNTGDGCHNKLHLSCWRAALASHPNCPLCRQYIVLSNLSQVQQTEQIKNEKNIEQCICSQPFSENQIHRKVVSTTKGFFHEKCAPEKINATVITIEVFFADYLTQWEPTAKARLEVDEEEDRVVAQRIANQEGGAFVRNPLLDEELQQIALQNGVVIEEQQFVLDICAQQHGQHPLQAPPIAHHRRNYKVIAFIALVILVVVFSLAAFTVNAVHFGFQNIALHVLSIPFYSTLALLAASSSRRLFGRRV